jgi:site-specific recombinase XerD
MIDTHVSSSHPQLEALIRRALTHLESLGYKPTSLRQLRQIWKRLCAFAQERSLPDGISEELVDQFLALYRVPGTAAERTSYHRLLRRATGALAAFAVHGTVARRLTRRTLAQLPVSLHEAQIRYLTYCTTHLGFRPTTLRVRRQHLDAFLGHVHQQGVVQVAAITPVHLSGFIRARCHLASSTLALSIGTLRSFLRVGFGQGWLPSDLVADVPTVHVRADATIPSVWTQAELDTLLAAVDVPSPIGKRDRAILLLACRLGMRAGDIRTLTLDAIHWATSRITFVQQKTGTGVDLPMPDEIAEALIDYLRHGRPATARREVFLRGHAPFEPFGSNNSLHDVVTRYRRLAGIALKPKTRRGLHSLRHTLATRLLARGVPLEMIGMVLGHHSLDVTRRYTKVDLDGLRAVALELPGVTP